LLTDLHADSAAFKDLLGIILDSGLQVDLEKNRKIYFPKGWKDPDFIEGRAPQVMLFQIKTASTSGAGAN
jgi:hypothetical protein